MSDKTLTDALEAYDECKRAADDNQTSYLEDYRFSLLDEQWDPAVKTARSVPGQERPMLTFNQLPTFGRQVVNDIRQNKPSIKVRPSDSGADIETALVYTGLIRNIENTSRADVARDTAAHCAVHGGFGYYRIDIDYACDDTFDLDIKIVPIPNPLSVLGDPYSVSSDSLDWNMAFVGELMTPAAFKEAYPKADPLSFSGMDAHIKRDWTNGDDILVAEYWKRSKEQKKILLLSDRSVVYADEFMKPSTDGSPSRKEIADIEGVTVLKERMIEAYVVDQCILNGQEVLAEKTRWVGKYIPLVPVYGEELNLEGKRILRSMIHRAKDAQRQVNYWETTATEMVALAPRVPFIGPKGAFKTDPRWLTANTQNHPFLEYDGATAPARQPLDSGPAVGAMQEAMRANDKMKAIIGMYDASLGARSNETSGKAINARKMEGDVGQFHFTDNLNRAIHCEAIQLLDLIPKVYTKDRIVRVMGDDGTTQDVKLGRRDQGAPPQQPESNAAPPKIGSLAGIYDLTAGKYDVTVEAGPSFTTQRQETAAVIAEMGRGNPAIWQIGGDIMVRNLDLKDGDELARRIKKMLPPQLQEDGEQQIPPAVQQMIEQGKQMIAELQQENEKLKQDQIGQIATAEKAKADHEKNEVERDKTALARERLPIENAQAQAALVNAQKELELTRAQLGATKAETDATQATGTAADAITQAAMVLAQAAQQLAASSAANAMTNAAPKRKRMTVQKVNGGYVGESVEVPDVGGVQ